MFQKISAAFVILTLLALQPAFADETTFNRVIENKTIRCGYFLWPPYVSKDPNTGKLSGINYDVMELIGRNQRLTIEWTAEIGVGEVVEALESNKVDMMCASVWPSSARMQNLTLTAPTLYSVVHAFVRPDDKRFDGDLEKANNKDVKVSGIDGDITQDLALEKLPNATIVSLPQTASGSEILLQVVTKKADITLVDQAIVNEFLKTNPGALRRVEGIAPVRVFAEYLALRRGEYQLRDMVNQSIRQLIDDGVIEKLTKKYSAEYASEFLAPSKAYERR